MKIKLEIELHGSSDIGEAISAVAEIYEMTESNSERSHIESGGSLSYNMEIED